MCRGNAEQHHDDMCRHVAIISVSNEARDVGIRLGLKHYSPDVHDMLQKRVSVLPFIPYRSELNLAPRGYAR